MIAFLLAMVAQDATMEALLRRFSDDDPSRRDEATQAIVKRWKEWPDGDLALLRKAGEALEQELADRAREALSTIQLRRRLGETLLAALPGLEETIRSGNDASRASLLASAAAQWRLKKLGDDPLRNLCALAVERSWILDAHQRMRLVYPGEDQARVPAYAPLLLPLLKDEIVEHRQWTAETLGGLHLKEYEKDVAALLKDGDKAIRRTAARSLATMGARTSAAAIAELLLPDDDYEVRLAAIDSLVRLRETDAQAERIVPLLADGSPPVIRAVMGALGQTGARSQAKRVSEHLRDRSLLTRLAAAETLGKMGAHEWGPALVPLLKEESCRRVAIEALGRMGARDQADAVVPFLKDEDEALRAEAARALGRMGAVDRASLLLPLLSEPSFEPSWKAVQALGDLVTPDRAGGVAKLLASDAHVVRGLAAHILARAGATDRADEIARLLDEGQPYVRAEAAKAIAALGAGRHLKAITALLGDEFEEVRIDAALSIGRLAGTPLGDQERAELLDQLGPATKPVTKPSRLAAQVALVWHGNGGADYQRLILRSMREVDQDFAGAFFEGLASLHEKAATQKLSRWIVLERAVDSIESLQEVLSSIGLRLENPEPQAGRVPPGTRTTPRRLLEGFWEAKYLVPEGDRVRLLTLHEAYDAWEARLEKK